MAAQLNLGRALLVLAACASVAPQCLGAQNPMVSGAVVLSLVWRVAAEAAPQLMPRKWLLRMLTLASVVAIVAGNLAQGMSLSFLGLLLSQTLALKLFEITRARDISIVRGIVILLVAIDACYLPGPASTTCALLALVLLVASAAMLERAGHAHALKSALKPVMQSVIVTGVLTYCFVLAVPVSLLDLQTAGGGRTRTGMSGIMAPGDIEKLSQNDDLAFDGQFFGPRPADSDLYWRMFVMSAFNGKTWALAPIRSDEDEESPDAVSTPHDGRISYRMNLLDRETVAVPVYGSAFVIRPIGQSAFVHKINRTSEWLVGFQRRVGGLDTSLTVNTRPWGNEGLDRTFESDSPEIYIPANNQKTVAFGRHLRESVRDEVEFVTRVLQTIQSENYYYTLAPGKAEGRDPVDFFWFTSKKGFCEHYASAFALIMRAGGVPSRVIGGYQGVSWGGPNGEYEVSQARAHAWVEVWIKGKGWVRIDPTAYIDPVRVLAKPRPKGRSISRALSGYAASFMSFLRLDKLRFGGAAEKTGDNAAAARAEVKKTGVKPEQLNLNWLPVAVLLPIALCALIVVLVVRIRRQRNFVKTKAEFLFVASMLGMPKNRHHGWREYLAGIDGLGNETLRGIVTEMVTLAGQIEYGKTAAKGEQAFEGGLKQLISEAPWYCRLIIYVRRATGICQYN